VDDDGAPGDRWAALAGALDPVENLRIIGEIQRMGLDAASRLVARFAGAEEPPGASQSGDGRPLFGAEPDGDADAFADLRSLRVGTERFIDLMAEVAKRFVDAGTSLLAEPDRHVTGTVVIATLEGVGTAEVTIPSAGSALTVSELRRHDGHTLPNASVRSQILGTTAGTTRLVLRVDVPPGAEAGTYHGVAVVEGLTDFSIPLSVRVGEP